MQYCGNYFLNYHQLLAVQETYSVAVQELLQNNRNSSVCMSLKNTMQFMYYTLLVQTGFTEYLAIPVTRQANEYHPVIKLK